MTWEEYKVEASRSFPDLEIDELSIKQRRNTVHLVSGLITELGELVDIHKKELFGHQVDPLHHMEEIGDFFWYLVNLMRLEKASVDIERYIRFSQVVNLKFNTNESIKHLSRLMFVHISDMLSEDTLMLSTSIRGAVEGMVFYLGRYNYDLSKILDMNIAKLKIRYPDRYTNDELTTAINYQLRAERDLEGEQKAMKNV